jgi:hypothetical protein
MTCNSDVIYLEWRQICDGIVNCLDASDEFNCHLLELNKCEIDEFQCRNGMCIPIELLFDVTLDCIDLSDERLCRKDQFSCGN